jgi:hypothetical protein
MKPTPISVDVIAATRPLWCNDKGFKYARHTDNIQWY